jgi:DNA-binding transcriptional MerR regulator
MDTLSIGQVARKAGVGVETVRFYEREGLLEEPPRRASGYRQYSDQVVKQRTEAKIAEVEQKLVELQRMRQALLQVASLCIGRGPTGRCPMLDALDQQEPQDPG